MAFKKTSERLGLLHHLILKKRTGNAAKLARQLGINRSSAYRYLDIIRGYGIQVSFDRHENSYVYSDGEEIEYYCGFSRVEKDSVG